MITYRRARKNWKLVTFWVFGALCILFASMISSRLEISLILVMVGGLLWIAVAIAAKHAEG